MAQQFLIWSMGRKEWWRPEGAGYTKKKAEAGRYFSEEALKQRLNSAGGNIPKYADVLVIDEG